MLLKEFAIEDPKEYRNYLKMSKEQFAKLLDQVSPSITKYDTIMKDAISARVKL